jgi:hypothetical protein
MKAVPVSRILILGGYGNFGKRIAEALSNIADITLLIAGRNSSKANELCNTLSHQPANCVPTVLDIYQSDFASQLLSLHVDLVIHTGGPFQGQDYRVPEACIKAGCHYIDLADDRRFVCDITSLSLNAKAKGVLVVSGASSVPGLSSVVIDQCAARFKQLKVIDFAIAPGNKAERGEATIRGILSYTGHPFPIYQNGHWVDTYGWMSPRRLNFGSSIGKRWLANIDIPDLELFPKRYPSVQSVKFQAGLELPLLHIGMVGMAAISRFKLIKNWAKWTPLIYRSSGWFKNFGTDIGGMLIRLNGEAPDGKPLALRWTLTAENGIGPYIPTLSAIILAKKMIAGEITQAGATPCLGMYSLAEFDQEASPLGIFHHLAEHHG